jgi:hypothetical protein
VSGFSTCWHHDLQSRTRHIRDAEPSFLRFTSLFLHQYVPVLQSGFLCVRLPGCPNRTVQILSVLETRITQKGVASNATVRQFRQLALEIVSPGSSLARRLSAYWTSPFVNAQESVHGVCIIAENQCLWDLKLTTTGSHYTCILTTWSMPSKYPPA